jgi:1-acyl-sn-glycerol-3-phosphate acyltransferase
MSSNSTSKTTAFGTLLLGLRSLAFFTSGVLCTFVFSVPVVGLGLVSWLLPRLVSRAPSYYFARQYTRTIVALASLICGVRYRVQGLEQVPQDRAMVIMARHESAWETLFLVSVLPAQTWIIKRELLLVPLIGQCLQALRAIAINRKAGQSARQQVVTEGTKRLAEGLCVTVFPEGTRLAPGERRRYGLGGGMLAVAAGAPILPVAHNAGECWPRNAFIKQPGEVQVVIGPIIETAGMDPTAITEQTQAWVDAAQDRITSPQYKASRVQGQSNVLA